MRIEPVCIGSMLVILVLAACSSAGASVETLHATSLPVQTLPVQTLHATSLPPTLPATSLPSNPPTPSPLPRLTLDAVGDIMLGRSVGDQVLAKGPALVFAGVQSVLDQADLRVGNLECAITTSEQATHKYFTLKAPPATAQALGLAGFDVLGVANNHAMDFGAAGLADTQKALAQYGILSVGSGVNAAAAHTPLIIERNGLRLAFLAYADVIPENSGFDARTWIAGPAQPGIAWADPAAITEDVSAARRKADLVIVLLHNGIEITDVIPRVETSQRVEAHAAIDAGATLVLGSHAHVLQEIESYHGGLIAYSLGNFVFDQYDGIANATIILRVVLGPAGVLSYDYVPVLIEHGLPTIITPDRVPAIATRVAPLSP